MSSGNSKETSPDTRLTEEECKQRRMRYETCFDKWYTDVFLKGKAGSQVGCQAEHKQYIECIEEDKKNNPALFEQIKEVMDESHKKATNP